MTVFNRRQCGLVLALVIGGMAGASFAIAETGSPDTSMMTGNVPLMKDNGRFMLESGIMMLDKGKAANDDDLMVNGKLMIDKGRMMMEDAKMMMVKGRPASDDRMKEQANMMRDEGKIMIDNGVRRNDQAMISVGKMMMARGSPEK